MKPLRILLVDDNPALVKTLTLFLESEGQEVYPTTDPASACNIIRERTFDLLIADLVMPNMDGIELLERCRERQKSLYAFLITGHIDRLENSEEDIREKFQAILPKPLDIDRLLEEIGKLSS